jgi:hypothetical protein
MQALGEEKPLLAPNRPSDPSGTSHRGLIHCRRCVHATTSFLGTHARQIAVEGDKVRTRLEELVTVPQGHGWFEGDDPETSHDSNAFGSAPLALISANVNYIVWPPERIGRVEREYPRDRVFQGYGRFAS